MLGENMRAKFVPPVSYYSSRRELEGSRREFASDCKNNTIYIKNLKSFYHLIFRNPTLYFYHHKIIRWSIILKKLKMQKLN